MLKSETPREITNMSNEDIRIMLNEHGVPSEKIDEFLIALEDIPKHRTLSSISNDIPGLKMQLEEEKDWRKKAAIAARIASINLGDV